MRLFELVTASLLTAMLAGCVSLDAPVESMDMDGHTHAGDHAQLGMERPAFPLREGKIPSVDDARSMEQVSRIRIIGDDQATPSVGIRSGDGSLEDPYVISGYYVTGDLYIQDTDACYEVAENFIGGQLSLNWNAQCVFVHHNHIDDLRVNENIRRTGYATGGLIEQNFIEYVGQLRHYDGEFRNNVVGPRTADSVWDTVLETVPYDFFTDLRAANIDGFNQGLIHNNTFYGSVDLDFHGHHHGTGFFAPHSHYHGDDSSKGMAHDHTDRWTSVSFTDNTIIDPEGYGLRYEDRNHRGDDRLANSEQEETLEMDHQHHLAVILARNHIQGAGLWVDVFLAEDNRHKANEGFLTIEGNIIEAAAKEQGLMEQWFRAPQTFSGIRVDLAKESNIRIVDNQLTWKDAAEQGTDVPLVGGWFNYELPPAAVRLDSIRDADIDVRGNTADGFDYGVYATRLASDADWTVSGNDFGDAQEVWYDESVESEPHHE